MRFGINRRISPLFRSEDAVGNRGKRGQRAGGHREKRAEQGDEGVWFWPTKRDIPRRDSSGHEPQVESYCGLTEVELGSI